MIENVLVIYDNLPYSVGGFVIYNSCEEYYTVVLNSRLDYKSNLKTFEHEIEHIKNNDFSKCVTVTLLEAIRHNKS